MRPNLRFGVTDLMSDPGRWSEPHLALVRSVDIAFRWHESVKARVAHVLLATTQVGNQSESVVPGVFVRVLWVSEGGGGSIALASVCLLSPLWRSQVTFLTTLDAQTSVIQISLSFSISHRLTLTVSRNFPSVLIPLEDPVLLFFSCLGDGSDENIYWIFPR